MSKVEIPKNLIPSDPRFGCGPSLIPVQHLNSLAETKDRLLGTSHRKMPVRNLVKEVQENFKTYFNLPEGYEVVLGNGGATFLWDMIGLGMVKKSSLHFTCGEFSNKWYKAHELISWINAKERSVAAGLGINPSIEEGYDTICTTLNETSTGVQISELPSQIPSDVILAMDATSGAGQIACDLTKVDFYYFSPQKVFAAEGGLFIGFISPKAKQRVLEIQADKKRYIPEIMNWKLCLDNSIQNQTYNTPCVSNIFLINEQLKKMNLIGHQRVCQMAKEKADIIYRWAESKSYLSCFIEDKKFRSQSVATIDLDAKYPVDQIIKFLNDQRIVVDIDGYRKLGRNQFRISMFHNISTEDVDKITKLISYIVENSN